MRRLEVILQSHSRSESVEIWVSHSLVPVRNRMVVPEAVVARLGLPCVNWTFGILNLDEVSSYLPTLAEIVESSGGDPHALDQDVRAPILKRHGMFFGHDQEVVHS